MRNERTQRDIDIARMSALKSAAELLSSFPDLISTNDDIEAVSRTAVRVADFFLKWIEKPSTVKGKVQDIRGRLDDVDEEGTTWHDRVLDECHALQKKLGLKLTDWKSDPCPWGEWENGGAQELLRSLREKAKSNGSDRSRGNGKPKNRRGSSKGLEKLAEENGYEDTGWSWTPPGTFPISRAQYGYAVSLYRRLGTDHDPDYLNGLTSEQASNHIDDLKSQI